MDSAFDGLVKSADIPSPSTPKPPRLRKGYLLLDEPTASLDLPHQLAAKFARMLRPVACAQRAS